MTGSERDASRPETRYSRRKLLAATSTATIGGLAGCSLSGDDSGATATPTATDTPTSGGTPTDTETPTDTATPDPSECTEISGSVDAGTTYDGCYLVTGTLDVAAGEVTIAAGSRFIFTRGTGIEVRSEGVIVAEGTASDPITMEGETAEPGYWKGVAIHSQKPANAMQYVELSSAGSGTWDPCCPRETRPAGINVWEGGILTLQNSTLRDNAGHGLSFTSSADLRSFQSNSFAGNGTAAVATTTDNLAALDAASDYGDGIVDVSAATVRESGTWVPINAAYRMYGRPEIVDDAVVTIEAGTLFTFTEDAGLRVSSGTLSVEGAVEAGEPVVMRGTTETPGFWRGLSIQSKKPDNLLRNLEIAHGGSGNWDPCCPNESAPANVNVFDDAIASISRVTFADSSNYGLLLSANSELRNFAANTFSNNAEASVWLTANNLGVLDRGSDYGEVPVYVRGNEVTEDATWKSINTTYDVRKNTVLTVTGDASVTVDAGADFAFREDAGLLVEKGSSFSAVGDPSDLIVFTGTTEADGWWAGIAVTSPANSNEISNAQIAYGGSKKWDPCCPNESRNANVNVFEGGYLSLTDSFLQGSENYATWTHSSATLDASGNSYNGDPQGTS
jgi:hypothetical protein